MPRSLVVGNGTMFAAFDEHFQMRDLYYPYVGMEDHTTYGNVHRIGVFVENKGFSWLSDGTWKMQSGYMLETLVGQSRAQHEGLGIMMTVEDSVHPVHNVLLRRFVLKTSAKETQRVRLFFNHNFHIYGDTQKDTAFYEPYTNSVIHFRQSRYFLIGAQTDKGEECTIGHRGGPFASVVHSMKEVGSCGINTFTTGKANYNGLEGTWRDAEDGILSQHPVEQGSVDSTVGIHCMVEPDKETEVVLWLCLGKTLDEVIRLQQTVLTETPERLQRNCGNYWKSWVNKTPHDFDALPQHIAELYKRSLLTIRLHSDNHGGILAAADSDIMAFNRDTYTYVWARDGALVSVALDDAGYGEVSRRFFDFCCRVQTPDGYLLHKYNPDGSLGSSWHAWYKENEPQLPIQEDETALVVYAMWHHFEKTQDFEFLQQVYESFVKPAARFMTEFREPHTGLPLPSYDPWEEQRGVFTYTTACTIAGLSGAAHIAQVLGHHGHSELYAAAADQMRQALLFHLFDEEKQRFLKKITRQNETTTAKDDTIDASLAFVWKLGVLPPDDPRVVSTMRQLEKTLTVRSPVGGVARYTGDTYHGRVTPSAEIPGNPWIITTLWLAQWHMTQANTPEDLAKTMAAVDWAAKCASSAGMLPEQMDPLTGHPLSVSPLTWSHAAFVETVLMYLDRHKALKTG